MGRTNRFCQLLGKEKHGQNKESIPHSENDIHVLLTATCPSGVLNTMPACSEKLEHQTQCLSEALADGSNEMLIVFSDMPSVLDSPQFYATFRRLPVRGKRFGARPIEG